MKRLRFFKAPTVALMVCVFTPTSAFAGRYDGWARLVDGYAGDTGLFILGIIGLLLSVGLLYGAIVDPDSFHKEEDHQYLMRMVGRKGRRLIWLGSGVLLIKLSLSLVGFYEPNDHESSPPVAYAAPKCGDPGTKSFINEEGLCDCPVGFTWADEDDEASVLCVVE